MPEGICISLSMQFTKAEAPWNIPYDTCDNHGAILQQSLYIVHNHALEKVLHIETKWLKIDALQPSSSWHMQHLELCLKATFGAKTNTMYNMLFDFNDFSPTEASWLIKTIPMYSLATADDNGASFHSDADKYTMIEMR